MLSTGLTSSFYRYIAVATFVFFFQDIFSHFFFPKIEVIFSPLVHSSKFRAFCILLFLAARNWNYEVWLSLNKLTMALNFLTAGQRMKNWNGVHSGTNTPVQKMAIYKAWSLCRTLYEIAVLSFFCVKMNLKPLKEFNEK